MASVRRIIEDELYRFRQVEQKIRQVIHVHAFGGGNQVEWFHVLDQSGTDFVVDMQ